MTRHRNAGTNKTSLVRSIERLISRPEDYVGMRVADFLNSTQKEGNARILKLLGLLRDLEHVPPADRQQVNTEVVDEAEVEILKPHQAIQEIGYMLSRYTLHPSIEVRGTNEIVFTKVAENLESDAANALTELFKVKKLHLLRTCKACREWFFGRRGGQEFCGSRKCWTDHRLETPRGQAIHKAEAKLTYWKNQRDLWKDKKSKLKSAAAPAKTPRIREIDSDLYYRLREINADLSDAKARHQNALKRMAKASEELRLAQQMTTGD